MLDDPEPRFTGTRRALIWRLALSSTLALMLPVVETVVVPPAEAQPHTPSPTPQSSSPQVMSTLLTRRTALAAVPHGTRSSS